MLNRVGHILLLSCITISTFVSASRGVAESIEPSEQNWVRLLGSKILRPIEFFLESAEFSGVADYQIGDSWGKVAVSSTDLATKSPVFVRSVLATAAFNGATAFYLGTFAGSHVMATNHHVLERAVDCDGKRANFVLLQKRFSCAALIGSWPDVDLALFTIQVGERDAAALASLARNFEFGASLAEDTPLLTAGFGIAGNPQRKLVVNENSDCRVMSNRDEFVLMADPDQYNPAGYKAWSFATGCSVSHGDSGSAMVDRNSGAVVGLVWTGAIPKDPQVQNSENLRLMQMSNSPDIWKMLTYAVPAVQIEKRLRDDLAAGRIERKHQATVADILGEKELAEVTGGTGAFSF